MGPDDPDKGVVFVLFGSGFGNCRLICGSECQQKRKYIIRFFVSETRSATDLLDNMHNFTLYSLNYVRSGIEEKKVIIVSGFVSLFIVLDSYLTVKFKKSSF
jgi:hypothetical protein